MSSKKERCLLTQRVFENALNNGEMFAVNPGEIHTINALHGICADFCISYSRIMQLMGYQRKLIVCNTHNVSNENTKELAKLSKKYDMSTMLIITDANGKEIHFCTPQKVVRGQSVIL